MITTLHIKNIGIIDDVTINLNDNLNILTGETGARKNINNWFTFNTSWSKVFKRNDKKRGR